MNSKWQLYLSQNVLVSGNTCPGNQVSKEHNKVTAIEVIITIVVFIIKNKEILFITDSEVYKKAF